MSVSPIPPVQPAEAGPGSAAEPMVLSTIAQVREAHVKLMRAWRGIDDPAEAVEQAESLREHIRGAGREIADPGERDEAQGILDYWISAVAALPGERYPSYVPLDLYVGKAAERAGASASKIYETLGTEQEKLAVRKLFEDLLTKGPNGVEKSDPRSRKALQKRLKIESLDRLLNDMVGSGALTVRAGDDTDGDMFEVTDANLAKSWPELDRWLDGTADYERKRDILLQRAERWDKLGRSSAYLAGGDDLKGIAKFEGESDALDDYIEKSQARQLRVRVLAVLMAFAVGVAFAFSYIKYGEMFDAGKEVGEQAAQREFVEERKAQLADPEIVTKAEYSVPAPVSTQPPLDIPDLTGAIWLGSDQIPQVSAPVWKGVATPPSRAQPGTTYRVLADINLREGLPPSNDEYRSQKQKAVVRAGTLLIVTDKLQFYDRPTGKQYWATVQIVPRVYVQYVDMDRSAVKRLRTNLSEAGFDVPAAERIASARNKRELRYFDERDRPIAERLLERLPTDRSGATGGPLVCRSFAGSRASNRFALEIWVDPNARSSGPTTCE